MTPHSLVLSGPLATDKDSVCQLGHLAIPVLSRLSRLHCSVFQPQLHAKGHVFQVWASMIVKRALSNNSAQPPQRPTNNLYSHAREFCEPESGSSSGATHVPDRTSTIPSPRTLPRCGSGLPPDTLNGTGITRNVLNDHLLKNTIFHNSKDLASSSQGLRPDITETARGDI